MSMFSCETCIFRLPVDPGVLVGSAERRMLIEVGAFLPSLHFCRCSSFALEPQIDF